jgi:hypothetical protein
MGLGSLTKHTWAQSASADLGGQLPTFDAAQFGLADSWGCPERRRDYVKLAAWVFAVLFGPVLVALGVWLA